MTQEAYRQADGGCCPCCRSGNLEAGTLSSGAGIVTQHLHCWDCGHGWTDLYRLAGYVRDVQPEGRADWCAFLTTTIGNASSPCNEAPLTLDAAPTAVVAPGGEPTGRYCVRTEALLHHEGECDGSHTEEADEVMDPEGNTIAYILYARVTNLVCALLNQAHGLTK